MKDGGWLSKYNTPEAQNGIEGTMAGLTDVGFNYNGAWGGTMAMGGSLPGSVGFTYARTQDPAPANGKYTKKTKASAQNGQEMKFYQEGLDWKPKNISRDGSVIEDDRGQWEYPGEITKINSNQITMQGVPYNVLGISDTGDTQMMQPGQDYTYEGESVTEYPMMQGGGNASLRSLMNDDGLKSKSDATKVVPQKTMTKEQAAKLKAKKDAEELQRRKTAIETSNAARNKSFSVQNLADESGAIGDKLRMFPNDPDSFIDEYINPGVMVGNMASGLGRVPLNIQEGNYGQAAMSVAAPIATGALAGIGTQNTGQFANNLVNPLAGTSSLFNKSIGNTYNKIKTLSKDIRQSVDENLITPVQFRKEIKELKNLQNEYGTRLQTDPVLRERLQKVLNINPDQVSLPNLTFKPNVGSFYQGLNDFDLINMDMRQLKRLNQEGYMLSPKSVYEHEFGHKFQKDAYYQSDDFKNKLKNYNSTTNLNDELENTFIKPFAVSKPTVIDNYAKKHLKAKPDLDPVAEDNKNYFNYNVEEMAHLREMRQNLLDAGYIKDSYAPISDDLLQRFVSENPKDRIASFVDPSQQNLSVLAKLFRNLPSIALPVTGTAVALQQKEKNGGWLSKYN
jgi:hypothetical protein